MDGFSSWEGNALLWRVTHNHGSTFVRALQESVALARFMAKYPTYQASKIELAR